MQLDIGQHIIKVVHEDAEEEFRSQLNALANKARASRRKEDWYEFWAMRESVASIKYSHALTAHRAQGSTFDFVFVSASDIMRNPNRTECRKCLYTAITRPTTRLFLN
jgi:ATP-dependent exoDNAse (exonuclease V) alpha subunit